MITLRPYQEECIRAIEDAGNGNHLVQMATGLGKTVVFASIPRHGRVLILSHRQELVHQPLKYFTCSTAVEMCDERADASDAEVVSASVQTMCRRLNRYHADAFHTIIVDECHHAEADSYKAILSHFTASRVLGFTATPNRGDGRGLSSVFQDIIFQRDLKWGIRNGYLSPIECKRVRIGYDLTKVASQMGDFNVGQLGNALNIAMCNGAIAEAVNRIAVKPVLIFAVNVEHARAIAALIDGAVALDGSSRDRAEVVDRFKAGEIPVLVNCQLFTEGTDLPNVRTVVIARPTRSNALYVQMVGRGTRLADGKDRMVLIDCVGATRQPICTAPSLIGLSDAGVPERAKYRVEGDLLDGIPAILDRVTDTPETWIRATETVNLWADEAGVDMHGIRWSMRPSGEFILKLKDAVVSITAPDLRGMARLKVGLDVIASGDIQQCMDAAAEFLAREMNDQSALWSSKAYSYWGKRPASDKQLDYLIKLARRRKVDLSSVWNGLTSGQASELIGRLA